MAAAEQPARQMAGPTQHGASRRYAEEIADKVVQVQQRAGSALGQLTLADFIDAE